MKTGTKIALWLLVLWILSEADREEKEETAQELYDEWYSPVEIADELDMDENDIRDIVWEDEHNFDYTDY
jgi:hypothetical protein